MSENRPQDEKEALELIRRYYPCYSKAFVLAQLPGYSWSKVKRVANRNQIPRLITQFVQPVDQIEQEEEACQTVMSP